MEVLKSMGAESVHCVVTSPPYWGLRDYGINPQVWDDPGDCDHVWGPEGIRPEGGNPNNGLALFCGDEPVGLDVNPQAFKESHFATFSEKLVTPLIKCSTSEKGCCPECGEPWVRVVEKGELKAINKRGLTGGGTKDDRKKHDDTGYDYAEKWEGKPGRAYESKTIGWKPGCECEHIHKGKKTGSVDPAVPCTVLDPVFGSGTVAVVAERYRRNWIGIELSKDYCQLAKDRVTKSIKQRRLF